MALEVRRIVAGNTRSGSQVLADGSPPLVIEIGADNGMGGALLWSTPPTPRIDVDAAEATEQYPGFHPPAGETRFVLVCFAPGAVAEMHATDTVDHFALFEGELELHLDQGPPTTVRAGDAVVCLGANHKWVNKSDRVAKGFTTLIGAIRSQ
jgi:quercetin dioxygenase-like cupin family protein